MRKRFGEILMDKGLISQAQLDDALTYQARRGVRLGVALVARGHLHESQLVETLGEALRVPVVSLRDFTPDPAALAMVSLRLCSEHDLFPYALRSLRGRKVLTVATSDPLNFRLLDELGFMTDSTIEAVLAPATDIDMAIRQHYGPRLNRAYQDEQVRLALQEDEDGSEMTIYRRGGGVEVVNTKTGPASNPGARVPRPREDSAVLLTEEVVEAVAPDTGNLPTERPIPLTQPKAPRPPSAPPATPPEGAPRPPSPSGTRPAVVAPSTSLPTARPAPASSVGPAPTAPMTFGEAAPVPTAPMSSEGSGRGFDDALGALIDQATEHDHAEAILRLERKFWALMRVLAKKGLLTNEDFLAELGEEEKWRG